MGAIRLLLIVGMFIAIGNCLLSSMRYHALSGAETMVWGFQFFTIGVTVPLVFFSARPTIYVLPILVLTLTAFVFRRNNRKTWNRPRILDLKSTGLLIALVVALYAIGLFSLRYHSSPDNHGFIAAISYLRDNPSLSLLEDEFQKESGATSPAALGQPTSRLDSTWNTPDARLRFAADMVLTVGRIGLPAALASLTLFSRSSETLGQLILLSSWIGIVAIGCGIARVVEELKYLRSSQSLLQSTPFPTYTGLVVVTVTSPLLTVMLVEGTATQVWTLAVSVSTLAMVLRITRNRVSGIGQSWPPMLAVGPLFLAVVYPHGLIVCSIILLMGVVLGLATEYRLQRKYLPVFYPYLSCLAVCVPVIYRTSRHTLIPMLKQFMSGVSGAPYNLGFLSWEGVAVWILSPVRFATVTGPGSGFVPVPENTLASGIQFIIVFATCLLVLLLGSRPLTVQKVTTITGVTLVGCACSIPYLRYALNNASTANSYLFNRNLALGVVFVAPLLASTLSIVSDFMFSRFHLSAHRWILIGSGFVIVVAQILPFWQATRDFQKFSTPFAEEVDDSVLSAISRNNSVFLSEKPEHRYFQLTAWGEFRYLTDGWEPRLGACYYDQSCGANDFRSEFEVFWLSDHTSNGNSVIMAELIGTLNVRVPIDGPIFLRDLLDIAAFSPQPKYFELLKN
jgi:hypothetical protein